MVVYISGKISGESAEFVAQKFDWAKAQLATLGHHSVNPLDNGLNPDAPWCEHMAVDIGMLLDCDAIYMLSDYMDSRGARLERKIAKAINLNIIHQPDYAAYIQPKLTTNK